jgi:hypothetical protein
MTVYQVLGSEDWYKVRSQHAVNHFNGRYQHNGRDWMFPDFMEADG